METVKIKMQLCKTDGTVLESIEGELPKNVADEWLSGLDDDLTIRSTFDQID